MLPACTTADSGQLHINTTFLTGYTKALTAESRCSEKWCHFTYSRWKNVPHEIPNKRHQYSRLACDHVVCCIRMCACHLWNNWPGIFL